MGIINGNYPICWPPGEVLAALSTASSITQSSRWDNYLNFYFTLSVTLPLNIKLESPIRGHFSPPLRPIAYPNRTKLPCPHGRSVAGLGAEMPVKSTNTGGTEGLSSAPRLTCCGFLADGLHLKWVPNSPSERRGRACGAAHHRKCDEAHPGVNHVRSLYGKASDEDRPAPHLGLIRSAPLGGHPRRLSGALILCSPRRFPPTCPCI